MDGVFIGPGDLAATLGHVGDLGHRTVKAAIEDALGRLRARGTPAGILALDMDYARECVAMGTSFTAIGLDVGVLARGTEKLGAGFRAMLG